MLYISDYYLLILTSCVYRPQTYEELFNLRHAQARNVVERIFGVIKKKFHLLTAAPQYPIYTQTKLVLAICALHNFVRSYDPDDIAQYDLEELEREVPRTHNSELGHHVSHAETTRANSRRDEIARAMWQQYQEFINEGN